MVVDPRVALERVSKFFDVGGIGAVLNEKRFYFIFC